MTLITAFYAGILGLIAIGISIAAGRTRGTSGILIGDGGNIELIAAMRRHANFVEYVPLTLILIGLLEMNGVSNTAIHGLGAGLVFVRLCHAIGFRADQKLMPLRTIGAAGSTLILLISSIWAITLYL
jgi:uncharacterized membrane protein YecN with MAPEG domain